MYVHIHVFVMYLGVHCSTGVLIQRNVHVCTPRDNMHICIHFTVICFYSPSGNGQPINGENIFPPTGSALESAKREGQKRKEGRRYAKDVILQLFLLWLVISICTINFANKHPALYQFMDVNDALRFPQHQNQAFTR